MKLTCSISRLLAAVLVVIAGCHVASARQLSVDEAIRKAATEGGVPALRGSRSGSAMQLVHTERQGQLNTLYVLNREEGGYVILSADNVGAPVLAYSDEGTYDPANIPPAMAAMLADYSTQIADASRSGAAEYTAASQLDLPAIEPLVKAKWNQYYPYNNECPEIDGNKCLTGCGSTALAQVMYYHKWPEQGKGGLVHNWVYSDSNKVQYSDQHRFSFSKNPFDWDNMLDTYHDNTADVRDYQTEEQETAVATLMYALGVAGRTNWHYTATGTAVTNFLTPLLNNLNYDKSLCYVRRQYFTNDEWIALLHNEFTTNGPVLLTGTNDNSPGHVFVGDGYDGQGRIHINWGWGGVSNGYFSCEALSPSEQGAGGSAGGYSIDLCAMIGIRKPVADSEVGVYICMNKDFKPAETTYTRDQVIDFVTNGNKITAMCAVGIKFTPGLKLVSESNEVTYVWSNKGLHTTNGWAHGPETLPCNASAFPTEGTYTVTPVAEYNGEIMDIRVTVGRIRSLKLVATESQLSFTPDTELPSLSVISMQQLGKFHESAKSNFQLTLTNNGGEFLGTIRPLLAKPGDETLKEVGHMRSQMLSLKKGETKTMSWSEYFESKIPAGDYVLYFVDKEGNILPGKTFDITITDPIAVTINSLSVPNTLGETTENGITATNVLRTFDIDMSLTSSNFDGELTLRAYVYRRSDYKDSNMAGSTTVLFKANEAVPANMTITIADKYEEGTLLDVYLFYMNGSSFVQLNTYPYHLYVAQKSGITEIVDDADTDAPVEYFNLQGIRVENPTSGLYIRRQGKKVEKIYLR